MPEIAVLLPSYNPGDELAGTLDSLRKQSVPFRLYLVDDGSKVKADYEALTQGMDCKIIRLPQNLGISGAMNAGLNEIFKGDYAYIARIDAGDFCTVDRFALQKAYLDAHPDIGILGSAVEFRLFDAANKLTGKRFVTFPLTPKGSAKRLYLNSSVIHPTMMIRTSVYRALKAYSEEYPAAEDFDLLWRAQVAGFKSMNLPQTLLIKEETPSSISHHRRRKQVFSRMRIQWANRNLLLPVCWYGLVKSAATFAAPSWLVNAAKFIRP